MDDPADLRSPEILDEEEAVMTRTRIPAESLEVVLVESQEVLSGVWIERLVSVVAKNFLSHNDQMQIEPHPWIHYEIPNPKTKRTNESPEDPFASPHQE